jgi:EthD domain
MTATLQPKQFYVARRHPAMSRGEFRANWRRHGELAMRLPLWSNICRYTQGDTADVPPATGERLAGFVQTADGIATVWFRDADAVGRVPADPNHAVLLADEDRIFERRVAGTSLFTEEIVERDRGATMAKLVRFIARRSALTREEFARGWERSGQELALSRRTRGLVCSYRRSVAVDLPGLPPGESTLGRYDGVAEVGFASVADLVVAVADDDFVAALDASHDEVAEPAATTTMITTELLLYGG